MFNEEEKAEQARKASEIKERFKTRVQSAIRDLPEDKKAIIERRQCVEQVEQRYRGKEFPANAYRYYEDLRHGDDFLTLVDGAIERWNNITGLSVADPLQRFAVDRLFHLVLREYESASTTPRLAVLDRLMRAHLGESSDPPRSRRDAKGKRAHAKTGKTAAR